MRLPLHHRLVPLKKARGIPKVNLKSPRSLGQGKARQGRPQRSSTNNLRDTEAPGPALICTSSGDPLMVDWSSIWRCQWPVASSSDMTTNHAYSGTCICHNYRQECYCNRTVRTGIIASALDISVSIR